MRLLELRLENFRSFGSPEVSLRFRPGLNVLSGPNGAGKTSLLEAAGQGLFLAHPGAEEGHFQRLEGGPWRLVARFEVEDRTSYRLEQDEKSCRLWNERGEELLASHREVVLETLRDVLGLDREGTPGKLFQQILCCRQGDYGRDLELGTEERRQLFDPLFKVDRFKNLDRILAPISPQGRVLEGLVRPLEESAKTLRQSSSQLPESEARRDRLEQEVEEQKFLLESTAGELHQVRGLLEAQLDRAEELRHLHQELSLARQTQEAKQEQLDVALARLEEARVASIRREACRPDADRYQRARKELKELEQRKQEWLQRKQELRGVEAERDSILTAVQEIGQKRESLRQRIREERTQLESMEDQLARLGDRVEHIDETGHQTEVSFEQARSHLAQAAEVVQATTQSIRELQKLEEQQEDRRDRLERLRERAQMALANREEQGRLPQLSEGLLRLRHQHSMILGKIELLETERVLLTSGQCPFVSQDCPGLDGHSISPALDQMLGELNRERYLRDQEIEEYENWLTKAEKAELTRSEGEIASRQARELEEEVVDLDNHILARLDDLNLAVAVESLLESTALLDQVEDTSRPDLRNRIEKLRGLSIRTVSRAAAPLDQARSLLASLQERVREVQQKQMKSRSLRDETREENARLDEQVRHLRTSLEAAERKFHIEKEALEERERRLVELDAELETQLLRMAPYRNLPEEEARLQEACTATESEYHEWLRLESEALDEEHRHSHVTSLERENTLLRESKEQLERRLALGLQEAGSQEEISSLEIRRDELTGKESRLSNQLRNDEALLEELKRELVRLEEEAARARELETTISEYTRAATLVARLRRVFQRAAPKLAGRYLAQVSREATRSYRTLETQNPAEITWNQDYAVELRGRFDNPEGPLCKPFSTLSGGDKVAVAISLRLALARVLSPLPILFLDEPTAHLDAPHQLRLARTLHSASRELGFRQILVVAHEPRFEAVPHHALELRKCSGRSQPLQGPGSD